MDTLITTDTSTLEQTEEGQRIECVGICHNGPIDDSPKAIRYAAEHDPEAPAAFLFICTGCDTQLALCEKKVDALLTSGLLGSGYMKCNTCKGKILISSAIVLPIV